MDFADFPYRVIATYYRMNEHKPYKVVSITKPETRRLVAGFIPAPSPVESLEFRHAEGMTVFTVEPL